MAQSGSTASPPSGDGVEWPLVGRAEELDFLRSARRGRAPASVVVSGLPGVGKSRLVAAALDEARSDGWGVLHIRASSGLRDVAFAPFRTALASPSSGELAQIQGLMEEALSEHRGEQGLLLAVDDAQDLDEPSAGFVYHVAAVGVAAVLVTLRSGAERPGALTALWKDHLAERVELQGLSRRETGELSAAALGGAVEDGTVERLWQLTDGNPLYVREVILSALESGNLQVSDSVWRWRGALSTGERLRELVALRLGRLEPDELSAVEYLAVAFALPLDILSSLAGLSSVEQLEARALVVVERTGRRAEVRLSHPLYGEVVRAGMPALRAMSTRRLLADALQRSGARRSGDRVSLARWALEAGIAVDPVSLAQAADVVLWHPGREISDRLEEILAGSVVSDRLPSRSATGNDPELAVRMARAAHEAAGNISSGAALAETLCWAGATEEAAKVLRDLQGRAPSAPDEVRLAIALAEVKFWGEHLPEEASEILSSAIAGPARDTERDLQAELVGKLAGVEVNTDQPRNALEHARQAAELIGDDLASSFAAPVASASLSHLGRCAEALELIDLALPMAMARGRHSMEVPQLLFTRAGTLGRVGRLDEAAELADTCHRVALSIESLEGTALFGIAAAEALLRQGRPASASRLFREAVGLLAERDSFGYIRWAYAGLARSEALLGDESTAAEALALAEATETGRRYFDVWLYDARAAVAWLTGRDAEAVASATAGAELARRAEHPVEEAILLHLATRIRPDNMPTRRLGELAEVTDSRYAALLSEHARAVESADTAGLLGAAEGFSSCGAWFLAAEAAAAAAELLERRRQSRPARAAARQATDYLGRCEGARSPLVNRLAAPAGLTRRELQIATLAVAGHSSSEIATRLALSARTVDSHLYRTYMKLGITSRAELEEVLSRSTPTGAAGGI